MTLLLWTFFISRDASIAAFNCASSERSIIVAESTCGWLYERMLNHLKEASFILTTIYTYKSVEFWMIYIIIFDCKIIFSDINKQLFLKEGRGEFSLPILYPNMNTVYFFVLLTDNLFLLFLWNWAEFTFSRSFHTIWIKIENQNISHTVQGGFPRWIWAYDTDMRQFFITCFNELSLKTSVSWSKLILSVS